MSAIAPRRKGWCPGRAAADGDRRRTARAPARLRRAAYARSGGGDRRWRARLRQRRDRAFRLAAICSCAASARATLPDLHARLAAADLLDADPEAEAVRNIVASPLARHRSRRCVRLRADLAALEREARRGRALCARCPRNSASFSTRGGAAGSAISTRTSASRPRATGAAAFAVRLGGDDALAAIGSPSAIGESRRRGSREAFLVPRRRRRGAADARPRRAPRREGRVRGSAGLDAESRPRGRAARAAPRDVLGASRSSVAAIVVGAARAVRRYRRRPSFGALIDRAASGGRATVCGSRRGAPFS